MIIVGPRDPSDYCWVWCQKRFVFIVLHFLLAANKLSLPCKLDTFVKYERSLFLDLWIYADDRKLNEYSGNLINFNLFDYTQTKIGQ